MSEKLFTHMHKGIMEDTNNYQNVIARIVISLEQLETTLSHIVVNNDISGLQKLLNEDKQIANFTISGTPLILSAYHSGLYEMVDLLLQHGVDPLSSEYGTSLVDYIILKVDTKGKAILLKNGYKFSDANIKTELENIVRKMLQDADLSALEKLVKSEKSVVSLLVEDMPLLVVAYLWRLPLIAEMLLRNGADPTKKGKGEFSFIGYVQNCQEPDVKKQFKDILIRSGWKFEQEDLTGQDIREEFDFQGFHVINAGLSETKMGKVLDSCEKLFIRMRKFGFGKLLYGPLIITSKDLEGQVFNTQVNQYKDIKAAALYYSAKDLVLINADYFFRNISYNLQLLAHELAHRHWYKFMDSGTRKMWTGDYEDRGFTIKKEHAEYIIRLLKSCAPKAADRMGFEYADWSQFNYPKFMAGLNAKQDKYRLRDVFDGIIKIWNHGEIKGNIKTERRKFVMESLLEDNMGMYGLIWSAKNISVASAFINGEIELEDVRPPNLKRMMAGGEGEAAKVYEDLKGVLDNKSFNWLTSGLAVGKSIVAPKSTTEYGSNNSEEDYAEAFGNFIANKPMPQEIYDLFARINGLRFGSLKNMDNKKIATSAKRVASDIQIIRVDFEVDQEPDFSNDDLGALSYEIEFTIEGQQLARLFGKQSRVVAQEMKELTTNKAFALLARNSFFEEEIFKLSKNTMKVLLINLDDYDNRKVNIQSFGIHWDGKQYFECKIDQQNQSITYTVLIDAIS